MLINSVSQNNISDFGEYFVKNIQSTSDELIKSENMFDCKEQGDEYSKENLDKVLKEMDKFLQEDNAHTEYSVHKDFGTIMIKIIDNKTKNVILEVPPKKILDMIASMCRQRGLLDKKA